jgi:hypothetical protein
VIFASNLVNGLKQCLSFFCFCNVACKTRVHPINNKSVSLIVVSSII